jgi:hypothetical protein
MSLRTFSRGLFAVRPRALAALKLGILPIVLGLFLALIIAGPWLIGGYIFATDWPGHRHFAFPSEVSSSYLLRVLVAAGFGLLGGEPAGKLFVLGILFVAGFTAYKAAPVECFVARAAGAGIYVLNPFVYGRLQYGQLFLLAAYAILPWVAIRLRRLLLQPGVATALPFALSVVLLGILSNHLLLLATVLVGALLLTHTVAEKDRFAYLRRLAPHLLLAVVITLAASAYWLLPLMTGSGAESATLAGIGPGDLVAYAAVPDSQLGLLPNLLGLYGFWAEGVGRFTSMKAFVPVWPAGLAVLLLVAAVGSFAGFREWRDRLAPWVAGLLIAAVVAVILEAGVSLPATAGFVRWLDANLPLYRGMRDAGKWGALLALVYSQLFPLGLAFMVGRITERMHGTAKAEAVVAVVAGLLMAFPLYYGAGVLDGLRGEIIPSQYPQGWYAVDRVLAADSHPGRMLFLPWHEYMALSFVRNYDSVVAPPAPSFFSTPVLVSADVEVAGVAPPTDPEQTAISDLVAAGNQGQWAQVLTAHNVKYVLLAREVDWRSYTYLDSQAGLVRVGDFGSVVLYRNSLLS